MDLLGGSWPGGKKDAVPGLGMLGVGKRGIKRVRLMSSVFGMRIGRRILCRIIGGRLTGGERNARSTGAETRIENNKEGP